MLVELSWGVGVLYSHNRGGEHDFTMWGGYGHHQTVIVLSDWVYAKFKISYFKAYPCFGGGVAGMCILSSDSNCAHVLTRTERDKTTCKHSRSLKDKKASVIKPIRMRIFCGEQCESDRVQPSVGVVVEVRERTWNLDALHQVSFPGGSWEYFSPHLAVHEKTTSCQMWQRARTLLTHCKHTERHTRRDTHLRNKTHTLTGNSS